jgi:proprotein convertase subtilisin/kexin type 5
LCKKCPYSCYGCTGPDPAQCVDCPPGSLRTLQANKSCVCNPGYYDDGFNALCKACKPTCLTC